MSFDLIVHAVKTITLDVCIAADEFGDDGSSRTANVGSLVSAAYDGYNISNEFRRELIPPIIMVHDVGKGCESIRKCVPLGFENDSSEMSETFKFQKYGVILLLPNSIL